MPATTPRPKESLKDKSQDREAPRYVRCDLSADQKRSLNEWASEAEDIDLLKWVEHRVGSGHTLTIRSNEVGYQASLTGVREASGHVNLCLIARASTPVKAIQACWYRDELVLQGVWPVAGALDDLDF